MRRSLYIILAIVAVGAIYLNRSYARIYDNFKLTKSSPDNAGSFRVGTGPHSLSLRYAALGDSLTAGIGADNKENSYPYLVAQYIAREKENTVSVLNTGVPGANTRDVIASQLPKLREFNPNIITLQIGTNDIHNFVTAAEFRENYKKIIEDLSSYSDARVIIVNIPYLGGSNLILPPYNWYFNFKIQKYNKIISELAAEKNLGVVDLYSSWPPASDSNESTKNRDIYSADLFHPSNQGYLIWAKTIYASYFSSSADNR